VTESRETTPRGHATAGAATEPGAPKHETLFDLEEMELNFGPQHPSTHGVLRLKLRIDGERIVDCYPIIGYLHRGTEKLFELHPFFQNVPHTDRMDYVAAATNNLAYVGTVEKLLGLVVPPRARYIRVLLCELQRISSHLLWLATHAIDIGAMTPFFYCFRERELILDLFEEYCGARLTLNCMRPGGQPYDLTVGWTDRCREFISTFPEKIAEYEGLLTHNRIWKTRTVGVGVLDPEVALDYGISGPMLRGSGIAWDLRKARPYECYGEVDFDVPVGKNGDTYDRYLVRMEEMRQSARIIVQCLDKIPDGPVMAKRPRVLKAAKDSEVYHSIEGPKGEIGFYIVGDGTTNPYRCHVRAPSFINLQSLPDLVRDQLLADLVAIIGTTDIVLGEVDR
jgi:NADH-quinone oxidoreductase subunit D